MWELPPFLWYLRVEFILKLITRSRKKEARAAHKRSEFAQKVHGLRAKLYAKKRHAEKVEMKKKCPPPQIFYPQISALRSCLQFPISSFYLFFLFVCFFFFFFFFFANTFLTTLDCCRIAMHQERKNKHVEEQPEKGAVPTYLVERERARRAKVLSNTLKQKKKQRAGKWDVPLPKVRPISEFEMFGVVKTGNKRSKYRRLTPFFFLLFSLSSSTSSAKAPLPTVTHAKAYGKPLHLS